MNRYARVAIGMVVLLLAGIACGEGNVFSLSEGDCFNSAEEGEVSDVEIVPCDDPHESEVYAVVSIAGPQGLPFPGETRVLDVGGGLCLEHFQEFVGRSYEYSLLDITVITPTKESWEQNDDREVTCAVYDLEILYMEGSMRGSAR